ncbi:MAG: anhydro-N-acetylmuramic acid kinase [Firmicutes bacterium]|nr:anhydro-N-acetylmuramic acid kinase [Bacillota bacterium]
MKIVGLMSGTSVDGIDAALVELSGWGAETRFTVPAFENYPFPAGLKEEIFALFNPATGTVDRICRANFVLGEVFAAAVLKIVRKAGLTPEEIDAVGSHGQTIYHLPAPSTVAGITTASTLQIGEPAVIAERTGITTVADFRVRDVAAGGQGAPLVPYVDYLLFHHPEVARVVQNIGGIGNFTLVPPDGGLEKVIAMDTGPGNMIIDGVARAITGGEMEFDRDGGLAAAGAVNQALLETLLGHPYLAKDPPKTTGREEFGDQFVAELLQNPVVREISGPDLVATVTAFTVESIVAHYRKHVFRRYPDAEVIVGGGGSYNGTLMGMLRWRLAPVQVRVHEDFGLSSDAKEAVAFAILANEALHGVPNNVPAVTGARRAVVMGKILPGRRFSSWIDGR